MPSRRGAPKATLGKLAEQNEQRHKDALARGSKFAAATERRRQQSAARSVDAAAGGTAPPAPPVEDATPPRKQRRAAAATPAADPPPPSTPPAPSLARELLAHGITGTLRRRFTSKS